MSAVDLVNALVEKAKAQSVERERRRAEAAAKNRERFPVTTKHLDALREIDEGASVSYASENGNEIGKPDCYEDLGYTVGGVRVVTKRKG